MKKYIGTDRLNALVLAFVLMITYAVPVNAAWFTGKNNDSWHDTIPEMLAAGEYEEGAVIAGIDMSKAKKSGDAGSALETKKLREDTEELISVNPEEVLADEEFYSWIQVHKEGIEEQDDGICITAIRRNDMTTARILELLASDDSIVFAEPNYLANPEAEDEFRDEGNAKHDPDASGAATSGQGGSDSMAVVGENRITDESAAGTVSRDVGYAADEHEAKGQIDKAKGTVSQDDCYAADADDAKGQTDKAVGTAGRDDRNAADAYDAKGQTDKAKGTVSQDDSYAADADNAEIQSDELAGKTDDSDDSMTDNPVVGASNGDFTGTPDEAPDVSFLQWSSSEDASLHAADKACDVSMKIPGWPDGSNMDHEIIVAVVDIPVDFTNPDLADRAYTFSPELKAKLGCDDHGFNAKWDSATGTQLDYWPESDHGSHVAGIIGASWDGKGISGVGSNVKIISVQNSYDGPTSLIDTLRGYNFIKQAVENGVDIRIVNNSWRITQTSKAIDAAVTELGSHGVVSVFAAGNFSQDLNATVDSGSFLADNPYVILVASTSPAGDLADSSTYGRGIVTLGAPGAGILSCLQTQDAEYIPVLAGNNKLYENFENPETDAMVSVCQIGYSSYINEYGTSLKRPDPEKPVEGTDGTEVSGSSEMGFEGRNILKVDIDRSGLGKDTGTNVAFKIDFGDVSGLGIAAGDILGFAYGAKAEMEITSIWDTASGSRPQYSFSDKNSRNCFNTYSYILEEGIDSKNLSFILEMAVGDAEEIYFDTFGIGNDKQPYGFKSGTSMACPAVVGAGAVIASRHYSELGEMEASDSAKSLASLIRSSVRPLASLKDLTSTGGIIDLTVDAAAAEPADQPGPDITDISVSGCDVTLAGTCFGSTEGSVIVRKYVIGTKEDMEAEIGSWTDRSVRLSLSDEFEGIIEAELTASNGKKDTIVRFISKSSNLFEEDLYLGSDIGELFEFDEPVLPDGDTEILGDFETAGLLEAGEGGLYYMPQIAKVEKNPVYRYVYFYNPDEDSWVCCPACPQWIKDASCAWFDGKLYVKGTSVEVDDSGTIPHYSSNIYEKSGTASVYSFTPGDSAWEKCSAEGVTGELTLFAAGSRLLLAGATDEEQWTTSDNGYPSVRDYDPAAGAGEPLGYCPVYESNPKVAYAGGQIYICKCEYWNALYVLNDNMSAGEDDTIELPEFYFGEASYGQQDDENYLIANEFALASCDDMLILTGPAAKDGSSDTFVLKAGEKSFRPYSRRISDAEVMMPCAAALDGRLYVMGASAFEPGKRVFRSTLTRETEKYTITYDLNGGSFDGSSEDIIEEHDKGTVISIHEAPERDGYTFTYWKGSEYLPGDRYTVSEDHTFTAQWVKDEPDDSSVDESDGNKDDGGNNGNGGNRGNGGNDGHDGDNGNGGSKSNSGNTGSSGTKSNGDNNGNNGSKSNGGNIGSSGTKSNSAGNSSSSSNAAGGGVRTGDESQTGLWATLALLAVLTLGIITIRIRTDA